jgi:hypothetical protein
MLQMLNTLSLMTSHYSISDLVLSWGSVADSWSCAAPTGGKFSLSYKINPPGTVYAFQI